MSLSMGFIHIAARVRISLLSKADAYSILWTGHIVFIYSADSRHLGCFRLLAINDANRGVQRFLCHPAFNSLGIYLQTELLHHVVIFIY